jgi:uncharacterized protein (DUF1501 family)
MSTNRRSFVRYASLAAAGSVLGLRPFGALNALAQSATDYKALVCVFLYGGNDANNMLVPFDTDGYSNYARLRGPLALAQNKLLKLQPLPDFSLHPSMAGVQALINSNAAALIANVGTLIQPTSKSGYKAGAQVPLNLFSHEDQQLEWQNASSSPNVQTGWAGRMSDLLGSAYNQGAEIPMITSVAGDTLFCNGASSTPVSVSPGNIGTVTCMESATECAAQQETAQSLLTFDSGLSLVQADNVITSNAYKYARTLTEALSSIAPIQTVFPASNGLAAQLKQIAQIMQARAALGVQRQVFFAGLGSFDTHANQLSQQGAMLGQLSSALAAFYQATGELGIQQQVTTFTMSDFSRAFQPNSSSGSDHAWGSHHIVLGGAVKGGQIYGTFPKLALSGPDDSSYDGKWIPSTGSVQYGSTLASWFGVSDSQLSTIFPNIGKFASSNLGFV